MSATRPVTVSSFQYEDLFEFIRRNERLPKAVDAVEMQSKEITALLAAIRAGDGNATIFKHPECDVYLLRLFKEKLIQPTEFLTCYDYLMALDQFYDRSKLYEKTLANEALPLNSDLPASDGYQVKEVSLRPLVVDGAFTAFGLKYIDKMIKRYNDFLGVQIDKEKLQASILAMQPIERNVVYIESNFMKSPHKFELLQTTVATHPLTVDVEEKGGVHRIEVKGNFMVPASIKEFKLHHPSLASAALRDYILQTYSDAPIECAARFGTINSETQRKQQIDNKRIYSLRNRLVASNMLRAHSTLEGAYSIATHDEVHLFLTAIMAAEQRQRILTNDIPFLLTFVREVEAWPQTETVKSVLLYHLEEIIYGRLNDINMFPYETYRSLSMENRYRLFLANKILDLDRQNIRFTQLSDPSGTFNAIVYLLLRHYYSDTGNKHIWESLLEYGNTLKDDPKTKLLTILAKNANQTEAPSLVLPAEPVKIDWTKWKEKLATENNSAALWKWIGERFEHNEELETLIGKCGVVYYHPFEPLTPAKHAALLQFVTAQEKRLTQPKETTYLPGMFSNALSLKRDDSASSLEPSTKNKKPK